MSLRPDNPTKLVIGMTGEFHGRRYRIAGRVVLGEMEDGELYSWNEFNLVADGGEIATLVYEETERGGEWRWFTMFEPEFPMTAADAATKREGDALNVDGSNVHVTLVRESCVYRVEGQAPEGVKVGSRANYFNAEGFGKMIVVSWTGEEMEFYHGMTISASLVAAAFNLPARELAKASLVSAGSGTSNRGLSGLAVIIVFGVLAVILAVKNLNVSRAQAVHRYPAPAAPLTVGTSGWANGTHYRIASHALVQIAGVGIAAGCQEFHLVEDLGGEAWVLRGFDPGSADWLLFTPAQPAEPLAPAAAGNIRAGQYLKYDGLTFMVTNLFREIVLQSDGVDLNAGRTNEAWFGFNGRASNDVLLARWQPGKIQYLHGITLRSKNGDTSFWSPDSK